MSVDHEELNFKISVLNLNKCTSCKDIKVGVGNRSRGQFAQLSAQIESNCCTCGYRLLRLGWRWDAATEMGCTHGGSLYPSCHPKWISRKHGFVTFHLVQEFTGHICIHNYLHCIHVYQSAECPACPGVDEDVEHALFYCPRFEQEGERFQTMYEGPLTSLRMERCLL